MHSHAGGGAACRREIRLTSAKGLKRANATAHGRERAPGGHEEYLASVSSYPPFSAGDHFAWQQAQSRPAVVSGPPQGAFDPRPTLRRSALDRVPVGRRVSGIHRTKTLLGVREDWRESYEPLGQGWIIGTHTWYGYDEHGRVAIGAGRGTCRSERGARSWVRCVSTWGCRCALGDWNR